MHNRKMQKVEKKEMKRRGIQVKTKGAAILCSIAMTLSVNIPFQIPLHENPQIIYTDNSQIIYTENCTINNYR